MYELVAEIRKALDAELYTLALQGTLALVDIAAAVGSPNGETTTSRFKAWFELHISELYPLLNSDDAWNLRCGLLHQGRTKSTQYQAIVFTYPGSIEIHDSVMLGALHLNVDTFCSDVVRVVEAWWHVYQHDEPMRSNAEHLIRRREQGLAPYIGGIPVLA